MSDGVKDLDFGEAFMCFTFKNSCFSFTTPRERFWYASARSQCGNMSRHVASIARRPLQQISTQYTAATTLSTRFLLSGSSTIRTLVLREAITYRLSARRHSTLQDVATKDTRRLLSGSPAPIASNLGLRGAFRSESWQGSFIESTIARRKHEWPPQQRRLFSERRIPEELREAQSTQSAAQSPNNATEEASKAAQESTEGSKTILDRLPHLHRPTKEELLAAATGFWQRLGIRFKWFSIRSVRPYTLDEIGAFVSWIFLGHVIWIVIGTTTFVSLAIWAVNTVFAQETVAGWVGNYLTKSSGVKVVFESAIVPTWGSGVITFHNVFVSRRPGQQTKRSRAVSKGSSTTAAAAAEIAMAERVKDANADLEDEGNYSQFDVTINTVNVTLSFSKWFNGKGLLHNVEILGVRGVIDRTSIRPTQGYVDPKSYRHEHNTGDFEIDDFKMSDVLLTVHQPGGFRPFNVSVYNCDLPRLRKQWLFYDFMAANNMSGSFDESLFTVHPRQVHGALHEEDAKQWKKHSRLRIDGLSIDHLNRGVDGPFSWIHEGNVDIVADVMIPNDEDGVWKQSWRKSAEAVSGLYDRVEASVTHASDTKTGGGFINNTTGTLSNLQHSFLHPSEHQRDEANDRFIVLDIAVHLHNIRARVPLFTPHLSYVNNALVRPIVAYINSLSPGTFIPIHCRVIKPQAEFDGSWTIFDSGLLDDLSREVYGAFARDVEDRGRRVRRMRKVGLWSLRLAAQALFLGLAGQLA